MTALRKTLDNECKYAQTMKSRYHSLVTSIANKPYKIKGEQIMGTPSRAHLFLHDRVAALEKEVAELKRLLKCPNMRKVSPYDCGIKHTRLGDK